MRKKNSKTIQIIKSHIYNNIKEYSSVLIIFCIGIIFGVMFVNQCKDVQKLEIETYINTYIDDTKSIENISFYKELQNDIIKNVLFTIGIWFAGTTVIGIPIVFGMIAFRGFCLGYTISGIIYTMGHLKGILFLFISIFIQNLIFIPALFILGVSCIRIYKSIIKNKKMKNIKGEIIRHTIISIIVLFLFIISSILKTNISYRFIRNFIKYF